MLIRILLPLLVLPLCAAPAQGARVVAHAVPGGVGLNNGYRPLPVFCRGNTALIHFQTAPRLKATAGPSEGRLVAGTLTFNTGLRRLSAGNQPGAAALHPDDIEVSCRQGQARVRAGTRVQLIQRP